MQLLSGPDSMPDLTLVFGVLALIFLVSALTSGLVERAPISFPIIFLGLGLALGGNGLGVIKTSLHDPLLESIATLSLAFVLYLDALNLHFDQIRDHWLIPLLALGPGALLTMLLIALAAMVILQYAPVQALLIGAVLASVDPVLLRDVVRDERIPHSIRESLRTEAGANDIIVLPVLLVLAAVASGQVASGSGWLLFIARIFLLGPLAGFAIGALAVYLMRLARSRTRISREYSALYEVGVMLAAYFAGTMLGGSGFLAVFTAGLATSILDEELCDCFLEYGEITTEMLMLLAFLLFGALLSTLIASAALLPVLLFTLYALAVARPVAIGIVLRHARISPQARRFIGWFGPRGLSSLLFGLLLISDNIPGAEQILTDAGVVVIVSVLLHGVSAAPLVALYQREVVKQTLPEEREETAADLYGRTRGAVQRISPQALAERLNGGDPPVVLDVRSRSSYSRDEGQIPGSVRVLPDEVVKWAAGKPKDRDIVAYCT